MDITEFMKKPEHAKGKAPKGNLDNPYLTARRTWNEQVGSLVSAKQTWQVIGILSMLLALAAIGGVIYIGSQSKFIPYVVEVDKFGQSRAQGAVEAASIADARVMRALVADFIQDARMVTPDMALQKRAVLWLYAHLASGDPARAKMDDWLNGSAESNPFKRAEKELVSVDIRSTIAQTETTWQVEWTETTRDRKGALQGSPAVWRALVTVRLAEVNNQTTDEQLRANPLGLYVQDFSWSRVQQ